MYIAQKLRQENICEYLLYMWQMEDLLRASDLDIDIIDKTIVEPYQLSGDEQKALLEWYENLIEMIRFENVQTSGHLQINKNVIVELAELHDNLIQTGIDKNYSDKLYQILPLILQLKQQQNDADLSDLEVCFNFLYGIMLLKLKKSVISEETLQAQQQISQLLALLAKNYKLYKSGDLKFDA